MRRAPGADDGGFTLTEVMVAMSILSIFLTLSTSAILSLYQTTNKTQSIADAQQQLGVAFNRLDRELRYSSGISTPGYVGEDPVVEFLSTYTGNPVCTQLRLDVSAQQLQQRTWTQSTATLTPSAWSTLANGVTSTSPPFKFSAADATLNFQRLTVAATVTSGGVAASSTRDFSATFTALNTSLNTDSSATCAEGRSVG
jgi:prepilin-type N-terminal cleavage/methylation domain-containing protein